MKVLNKLEDLRHIYGDIIRGYSYCRVLNCHIIHLNELNHSELNDMKNERLKDTVSIPSERDRAAALAKEGVWTPKDDEEVARLELIVSDNEKNIEKMVFENQKRAIQKIVDGHRLELENLLRKKSALFGLTREKFGAVFVSDVITYYSFFKNISTGERLHSLEDYENLPTDKIALLNQEYSSFLERFNERNFRLLAAMPFVINAISYAKDSASDFYGKPVAHFTYFQTDLLNRTMRNIRVLENSKSNPPDLSEELTEQELLAWYDSNYSILNAKSLSGGETVGVTTSKKYVTAGKKV